MEAFGPFRLVQAIGAGGMGEVFLARTPWTTHPLAAVKRLHQDAYQTERFVRRFEHEAQLAVRLRHAHIVTALDVGAVDEQLYVASELVVGQDVHALATKLGDQGLGAPPAVALWILTELLDALTYAHGVVDDQGRPLRLIHRDITPNNVLLDYEGVTKLADFGMAKSILTEQEALTGPDSVLGTPSYLPPEALQSRPITQAADLYGVGTVIYTLLTSLPPYWGTVPEIIMKLSTEPPYPLAELRPDLPVWFVEVVQQLMARRPEARSEPDVLRRFLLGRARKERLLAPRRVLHSWMLDLFKDEYAKAQQTLARARKLSAVNRFNNTVFAHVDPEMTLRSVADNPIDNMPDIATMDQNPAKAFEDEDTLSVEAMKPKTIQISPALEKKLQGFAEPISSYQTSAEPRRPPPRLPSRVLSKTMFVRPPAPPRKSAAKTSKAVPARVPEPPPSVRKGLVSWKTGIFATLVLAVALTLLAIWWGPRADSRVHADLELRYFKANQALLDRKKSQRPIPANAWTLSTEVANALMRKDYHQAEANLTKLEHQLSQLK